MPRKGTMKFFGKAMIVMAILVVMLFGCESQSVPPVETSSSSTSVSSSQESELLESSATEESLPLESSSYIAPEIVGVVKEDVDFLTPEQWELIDNSIKCVSSFEVHNGIFIDDVWMDTSSIETMEVNDIIYEKYHGEKYEGWDDFHEDMLSFLTEDYFNALNTRNGEDNYISVDGELYYRYGDRGGNHSYLYELTRYELVESTEEQITYNLIAYYASHSATEANWYRPETMKRCPVVLKNTPNGWRVDKITLPN